MGDERTWDEKAKPLEAKLKPERIRATLAFAGLYQLTHELIKNAVLDQVREFYWCGFDETGMLYNEEAYRTQVLSRSKNKFRASLLWLIDYDVITLEQADRLEEIANHRHDLTHEIDKYVMDLKFEPKVDLFVEAVEILRGITRFWTRMEFEVGTFAGHEGLSIDYVTSSTLMVLQMCIDAYAQGLPDDRNTEPR